MRKFAFILSLLLLQMLLSCSSHIWQASGEIKPITYEVKEGRVKRSIGNLRHLAILPILYERNKELFEKELTPAQIDKIKQTARIAAVNFLTDHRGYEVMAFDPSTDKACRELNLSAKELLENIDSLTTWALSSSDGEVPPENIVTLVSRIGKAINVDGLIIIQGHSKPSSVMIATTILTASLTWPLLLAANDFMIRADLYEVSSGRIVWRNRIISFDDGGIWGDPRRGTMSLFGPIEPALPAVFETE